MKKSNVKEEAKKISDTELVEIEKKYDEDLSNNPEYSLDVDPLNKYNFNDKYKKFIEEYVQFKSLTFCADRVGLKQEEALNFFSSYNCQQEIRRINRALYHRQFRARLLDLDDIGGYLSSLITDENVPIADQLKTADKLKVVSMLMNVIQLKKESIIEPEIIMQPNLELEIKNLSINTIQQLLSNVEDNDKSKTKDIQSQLPNTLSPEEKEYLQTLPTEELLQIIEQTNKEKE